jgi:hypothetical protein
LLRAADALLFPWSAMTNTSAYCDHSWFIVCLTIFTTEYVIAYKVKGMGYYLRGCRRQGHGLWTVDGWLGRENKRKADNAK